VKREGKSLAECPVPQPSEAKEKLRDKGDRIFPLAGERGRMKVRGRKSAIDIRVCNLQNYKGL
jgi:hypothetical protein